MEALQGNNSIRLVRRRTTDKFFKDFLYARYIGGHFKLVNCLTEMSSTNTSEVGQLIDILDDTERVTDTESCENIKEELEKTKKQLDDALSEVAVAQVLQENLTSVERQKVV